MSPPPWSYEQLFFHFMHLKETIYKFDITQLRHDQLLINYHLLN
jgi:hypothetical protein